MPISIVAKVVGFEEVEKALALYPQHQARITAERFDLLGNEIVPIVASHTPVGASGNLRVSTRHVVNILDLQAELLITQPAINPHDGRVYQDWVTSGRLRGLRPPLEPIENWVRAKFVIHDEPFVKELTFNIARKIGREGTPPSDYIKNSLLEAKPLIDETALRLQRDLQIIVWQEHF